MYENVRKEIARLLMNCRKVTRRMTARASPSFKASWMVWTGLLGRTP